MAKKTNGTKSAWSKAHERELKGHSRAKTPDDRNALNADSKVRALVCVVMGQERTHAPQQTATSSDHLVGAGNDLRRHREAKCLGGLEVNPLLSDARHRFGGAARRTANP